MNPLLDTYVLSHRPAPAPADHPPVTSGAADAASPVGAVEVENTGADFLAKHDVPAQAEMAAARLRAALTRHGLIYDGQFDLLRGDVTVYGKPRVTLGRVDPQVAVHLADLLDQLNPDTKQEAGQ